MSGNTNFSKLRSNLRSLETESDKLFIKLSNFIQKSDDNLLATNSLDLNSNSNPNLDSDIEKTILNIEKIFSERKALINNIQEITPQDSSPQTLAKVHSIQRHNEILKEHELEFNRIRGNLELKYGKRLLFGLSGNNNNNNNNNSNSGNNNNNNNNNNKSTQLSEEDYMLQERGKLNNSHSLTDTVLEQAIATRDEFKNQNSMLASIHDRSLQTVGRIPGMNSLINKIHTRKRRDSIIIASVVTTCVVCLYAFT